MKLKDCEVTQRHVRNVNVAFIFGSRALTDAEAQALLAEYSVAHGPNIVPGYVSPDGWQILRLGIAQTLTDPAVADVKVQVEVPPEPKPKKSKGG